MAFILRLFTEVREEVWRLKGRRGLVSLVLRQRASRRSCGFYWGPSSGVYKPKEGPWQASLAGSRPKEGTELLTKTLQRQRGRNTPISSFPTPFSLLLGLLAVWCQLTREPGKRSLQQTASRHRAEQGKGDEQIWGQNDPGPTQGEQSPWRDTKKPDCGHIPKPLLNLASPLINKKYYYILHLYGLYYVSTALEYEEEKELG